MYNYDYYSPFHFLGGVFSIVVWVLIIWAIIALFRSLRGRRGYHGRHWHMNGEKDAIDILRERYAKGEVDKAEFESRKKDLEQL